MQGPGLVVTNGRTNETGWPGSRPTGGHQPERQFALQDLRVHAQQRCCCDECGLPRARLSCRRAASWAAAMRTNSRIAIQREFCSTEDAPFNAGRVCGCYERVLACAVCSGSDLFSKINPVLILGVLVEHHVAKMEQCKQWRPHPHLCFLAESNFVQCGLQRPSRTRSLSPPWYADSRCWRLEAKMPASWPSARHRSRTSHPCHQGIQSCLPSRRPRPRP